MWKMLFYSISELLKLETPFYFFIWFFVLFILGVLSEIIEVIGKNKPILKSLFKASIECLLGLIICIGIGILLFRIIHFIFPGQIEPYDVAYGRWLAFIALTLFSVIGFLVKITKQKTRIWLKPTGVIAQFFLFSISVWGAITIFQPSLHMSLLVILLFSSILTVFQFLGCLYEYRS
ncbi:MULTISPECIES: DUF5823 family protein [unclassified Bacillus (in: firmicutes)]|uniref:DUF5823 family protein n=1 Tax=unclassified Bacillus (in: firmicutes) TaxID=185979 RepID=UPI0008EE5393|nr:MULTISPECIES: DUF5823 family protein [unclassified Bacillus (in: firmicutes)]SFJ47267.1 hypothetical protein SAMN04488574_11435 [Bacillus sp. 71mf]SFT18471.1 hypothetical protein SAMN04488145_11745 [Bacillus sp. 103mf]